MLFIYNETDLNLKLQSYNVKGTITELRLEDVDDSEKQAFIVKSDNELAIAAMKKRYANGHVITENPAREYVIIKDHRVLVNSDTDEYIVSNVKDLSNSRPKEAVKNLVVLVLEKNSVFFAKKGDLKKRAVIHKFGRDYTVAVLHIKSLNWASATEPINVLIKSDTGNHKKLNLTYSEVAGKNDTTYKQNIVMVEDYEGEFPTFAKRDNRERRSYDSDRGPTGRTTDRNRNYNRGGYTNQNQNGELRIPKYEGHESRSQGGRNGRSRNNNNRGKSSRWN